jgi:hypothetical protein
MLGYWIKDPQRDTKSGLPPNGLPMEAKDDILMRVYLTDGGDADPTDEWRTFDFSESSLTSYGSSGEVAASVHHLDVKYYDYEDISGSNRRLKEYEEWDSRPTSFQCDSQARGSTLTDDDDDKLPVAVKITIAVGDKDELIKPIRLSTIVYLENAVRR